MPKRFSEYTVHDHLHLRSLTQIWKTWRYRVMDEKYMALPPVAGDIDTIRKAIAGRNILVTIAFEDPSGLAMHMSLVQRYVEFDVHIIVENSRDDESIALNREVAASLGGLYLRLPPNPWTKRNDSRSHGISLNWMWHNIIRPARPHAFGFIDDDMFPIEPVDPFAPLASHGFYGDQRFAGDRWFLWAGYCFFLFDAVCDKKVDFGLDWFIGLDTGGANWEVLYRHIDRKSLPLRIVERMEAIPGISQDGAYFEKRHEWIHEVGWPRAPEMLAAKRASLIEMLAPHLDPEFQTESRKGKVGPAPESAEAGTTAASQPQQRTGS